MELHEALEAAEAEYLLAQEEQDRIADRVRSLEVEVEGLRLAIARQTPPATPTNDVTLDHAATITVFPQLPSPLVKLPNAFTSIFSTTTHEVSEKSLFRRLARTDAVLRVLREADQPMAPKEISRVLVKRGRPDDSPNLVSSTLDHLMRNGFAQKVGRAQWIATPNDARLVQG
jgi:hypothetical protein